MGLMYFTESSPGEPRQSSLCEEEHILLRNVARGAIESGLKNGSKPALDAARYPRPLREARATFVTLHKHGDLRGCIGTLEASRPLVEDVSANAFNAAFRDPRFAPVQTWELAELDIHISVLTPALPMQFTSEEDLLGQLRPGIDGLVLKEGARRGTFLPSVWESLPDCRDFLCHLKAKAGLPKDYWSPTLEVSCYTTESF